MRFLPRKYIRILIICAIVILSWIVQKQTTLPTNSTQENLNQTLETKQTSPELLPQNSNIKEKTAVLRVIDGDTIEITGGLKVRYIGVDTPEISGSKLDCYGTEATKKNKELVEGKQIEIEKDISETDRYGRLLRYVYVDGKMINEMLVKEGYAKVATFPPDVKNKDIFLAMEQEARSNSRGLWGSACNKLDPGITVPPPIY